MSELRDWQQRAIDRYHQHPGRTYLISATPAAGKTTCALTLCLELLESGTAQRIAVVVPTDSLRQQWADKADELGLSLIPVSDATDYEKAGYHGYVATYAQLSSRAAGADLARRATRTPTAVILDEIHHAGESKAWGEGIYGAYEHAVTRIALTGTPWRQSKYEQIPFVAYDSDGTVHVDFPYEYAEAVADEVCRSVEFHAYDGEARWRDCGTVKSADLGGDMDDESVGAAMDAILRPDHEWMPTLLRQAALALDELRHEVPDAGGLVVAHEQWQARKYADILTGITGEEPIVATSDDPNSQGHIAAYRHATSRWLVTVKMVSEGVDIPRLGIVVYAAKARTPLFFRQVVGRIVRRRDHDPEFNARMYIPAIPALMAHAAEIEEELRHQLEIETERDEVERAAAGQRELPFIEPIGASEAVFDSAIYRGGAITAEEHAAAEEDCRRHGIPVGWASNIAKLNREKGHAQRDPFNPDNLKIPPVQIRPRWRREQMLRSEIDRLVGKYAYRSGLEKKEVNQMLLRAFGPRKECSIERLESIRAYVVRLMDEQT